MPEGASFFAAVVAFDDFAVVAAAGQGAGGLLDEGEEEVDAEAHVGGEDDGDFPGGGGDEGLFAFIEAGGADDPGDACGDHVGGGGSGGDVEAEVDGHIRLGGEGFGKVADDGNAQGAGACGGAGILADEGGIGPVHGGHDFKAGKGAAGQDAGDGLSHAARGAHQQDPGGGGGAHGNTPALRRVARSFSRFSVPISHRGRR